ncbi:hemerythrin domain-containing protein [Candidatus Hecatella orcuttiae]|jgi:hemerythrin-like domain-containing protein|uniref:hemerythrin domain-containing protein n=1 Tax=Candidatus Hecatella orcuttiae TaxID=1935119 RepID=UPI002867BD7D|nr:hemerythrin domain-containing protein [Candidatus Hecatella orcuttiae]
MFATDILKEEHRMIKRMLKVLTAAAQKLEGGEEVSPAVFEEVIDFIRTFADRCHHGKEEQTLFPVLERRGLPREGGPTGTMRMEHERGREFVKAMAQAVERYRGGDEEAKHAIVANARGYVDLLTQHISKEDDVLYPLAEQVLGKKEHVELLEKFEEVEKTMVGEGKHQQYIKLLERLEREFHLEPGEASHHGHQR